jgi:protein-tyrosine phosphatase
MSDLPLTIDLQLASNLRDLGGWPVADGRRVRTGRLYRSAALGRLSEGDVATLSNLGIRTICDFRGTDEREHSPTVFDGPANHSLPIQPTVGASLRDIMRTRDATGADMMTLLERAYTAYALASIEQYRTFFALLLEDANRPLLFHCSAGKDRTGFAAALVLTALGASWETVMEDYLATNRLWRGDTVISHDLAPEVADVLLRAHPNLLETAFEAIRRTDGSVEAYLERALGVDDAARRELRASLLE